MASFPLLIQQGRGARLLDLGAGCGVVALGMICLYPGLEALGLDIQPELVSAARINADRLGFSDRFTALCGDVAALELPAEQKASFTLVVANPPYRQARCGRVPASAMRRSALFETDGGLLSFCRAAEWAMRCDGRFAVVFPAARLEALLSAFRQSGLRLTRLLPVQASLAAPARLVLAEAAKTGSGSVCRDTSSPLVLPPGDGKLLPLPKAFKLMRYPKTGDCRQNESAAPQSAPCDDAPVPESPLVLYERRGAMSTLTQQAITFCPFLACNG